MTITELNNKKEAAQTAANELNSSVPEAIQNVHKLIKGHEKQDEIRCALNAVIIHSTRAVESLREYVYLLDGIMRETELKWPPSCVQAKK